MEHPSLDEFYAVDSSRNISACLNMTLTSYLTRSDPINNFHRLISKPSELDTSKTFPSLLQMSSPLPTNLPMRMMMG